MEETYTIHKLKTWPVFFEAIMDGTKTFEVRYNDRRFKVGDRLDLLEFDPDAMENGEYTGRHCHRFISYILDANPFIDLQGYAILGLQPVTAKTEQETKIPDLNFRRDIAEELSREELIDRICEMQKHYVEMRQEWFAVVQLREKPLKKFSLLEESETITSSDTIIEQEKPSEQSAEEEFIKHFDKFRHGIFKTSLDAWIEDGRLSGSFLLAVREYARQKHPVTDDMISAKLDTVNFETSRERETAFDLLVWPRDLTGQEHLPTDSYPKSFVEWTHTGNNVNLTFREETPQWWLHTPELNWRQMTLDELFIYWKERMRK